MNSYKRFPSREAARTVLFACALIAISITGSSFKPALAVRQYQEQTIYCASDDGRRNYCNADTRNGVQLVKQRSEAACIEGRTWGFDQRGIWVDRGCRADFHPLRGNLNSGGGRTLHEIPSGNPVGRPGAYERPNGRVIYSGPIVNRGSNKVLDVERPAGRDGANIQQWEWADQENQTWDVYDLGNGDVAIISQRSGFALTVEGGRNSNGASIIQRRWNGSRQQHWRIERVNNDWSRIISVDTGKVLDVSAQSRNDGAPIQQWDWADQANQQWRLGRR